MGCWHWNVTTQKIPPKSDSRLEYYFRCNTLCDPQSLKIISLQNINAQRYHTLDLAKFIAAFGVIIIHVSPGDEFAKQFTRIFTITCVPFFLIASTFLTLRRPNCSLKTVKYERLIIPYISWSFIYLILRFVKYKIIGSMDTETFDWKYIIFFGGASTGLYFLPMLLVYQLVAISLRETCAPASNKEPTISPFPLIVLIGVFIVGSIVHKHGYLGFKNLFCNAVLYTIAASALVRLSQEIKMSRNTLAMALVLAPVCVLFAYQRSQFSASASLITVSIIVFVCLHPSKFRPGKKLQSIVSTSFGIYLTHQLFDRFLEALLPKLNIGVPSFTLIEKLLVSSFILSASILTVLLIRKSSILGYILLGEDKRPSFSLK